MNGLFPAEQFMNVLIKYNTAIWPMQVVAYILGIAILFLVVKKTKYSSRISSVMLSFLWLWNGIVFFLFYFGPVFTPSFFFGGLFIIQGLLFLGAVIKPRLSFGPGLSVYSAVGILFIAYAMVGYPVLGPFLGHSYPFSAPFGLTPCPTNVFTFGLFLLSNKKIPKSLLIIPLLWAIFGGFPAVIAGMLEDIGLIVAGIIGTVIILYRDWKWPAEEIWDGQAA
jgi:hypothetical protein